MEASAELMVWVVVVENSDPPHRRDDRATTENVWIHAHMILFRMLAKLLERNQWLHKYGKANVYYAVAGTKCINNIAAGEDLAVRFSTSILVFKDRDRYVSGE